MNAEQIYFYLYLATSLARLFWRDVFSKDALPLRAQLIVIAIGGILDVLFLGASFYYIYYLLHLL
jgi:hypothetical protein